MRQERTPPTAPGHCRHCRADCKQTPSGFPALHSATSGGHPARTVAYWVDGNCPYCVEAERIAARCEQDAATHVDGGRHHNAKLPDAPADAYNWGLRDGQRRGLNAAAAAARSGS